MTPKPQLKKLRQLLKEKQEPFELEDYLRERKNLRRRMNRESDFACTGGKLCSIKKGFVKLNRRLRDSYKKLVYINERQKTKNPYKHCLELRAARGRNCLRDAETDKFSSAGSTMVLRSFSGRDSEKTLTATRRDHVMSSTSDTSRGSELCNLKAVQDMKTGRPGLNQARPNQNQLGNGDNQNNKAEEDSVLSATLWELLLYSASRERTSSSIGTAELEELVTSNSGPRLLLSKRVLHKTKQFFDCVKEMVEAYSKRGKDMGTEELGRLICKRMNSMGDRGKEAKLSNLIYSDYLSSLAEWRDMEPQKQLIGMEIGDIILKEIISEVLTD